MDRNIARLSLLLPPWETHLPRMLAPASWSLLSCSEFGVGGGDLEGSLSCLHRGDALKGWRPV